MPDDHARLTSLDCLRGFAILGILLINIRAFGQVSIAHVHPPVAGSFEGLDFWLWFATHVLAEYKFIPLLAALFGAGMVIQGEQLSARGEDPGWIHRRRMLSLALIGFLHITLVWYGDILLLYAMVGLIAQRFRGTPPQRLFAWAFGLYLVPTLIAFAMGAVLHYLPHETYQELVMNLWSPESEMVVAERDAYQGGWWQQLDHRLATLVNGYIWGVMTEEGWRVLAMMLAGMALYRVGFMSGEWPLSPYRRLLVLGLGVGLPLSQWGVLYNLTHDWEMAKSLYLGRQFNIWAGPFVALAWASMVMVVVKQGWVAPLVDRLNAVGRMALTAYLSISVIGTAIFYGVGLGLFADLGRAQQLLVTGAVWLLFLVVAPLWLRFFRYGPAEWLWRWATYGARPPLLRR